MMLIKRSLLLFLCAALLLCLLPQAVTVSAEEAHEHDWGAASYYWSPDLSSVTAQRICLSDNTHIETETVDTVQLLAEEPTCTEAGVMRYTAYFTNPAFTTQTRTRAYGSALGHDWGAPSYSWSANKAVCTAKRVCRNDASHVDSETVQSTSVVTSEPTCTKPGVRTYIAKFTNPVYLEQTITEQNVPPLGHSVSSWTVTTPATCTTPGTETGSCSRCGQQQTRQIPAAGHNWGTPIYSWSADYTQVSARRSCKTDSSHVETETVTTTAKVTKEATATTDGEITFTAVFSNPAFGTQTKVIVIPREASGNPFYDVPSDRFYYRPVLWVVANKITTGITATSFMPEKACSRAEAVTFLWRAYGSPEPAASTAYFSDVIPGWYYYKPVRWAVQKGITNGMTPTTFEPDGICTRGQIVTLLWRAEGKPNIDKGSITIGGGSDELPVLQLSPFYDVDPKAYYYNAMLWAVYKGITNGMTPTTFEPDGVCTRGQVVTFLYRVRS